MSYFKNFLLFTLWMIIILYLSFAPLKNWPQPSFLEKIYMDKLVHVFMYLTLSFLLLFGIARQQNTGSLRYAVMLLAASSCAGYGITIEILQPVLTMYRKFEWMDMVANAAGAFGGIIVFRKILLKRWLGLGKVTVGENFRSVN